MSEPRRIGRPVEFTDDLKRIALAKYSETAGCKAAAAAAGVTVETINRHRREDPDGFGAAWAEAQAAYVELLEAEAHRRGVEGETEEHFGPQGQIVRRIRKYSDGLLTLLLKANAPKKYRENQRLEISTSGTVNHEHRLDPGKLDHAQRAAFRELLRRRAAPAEVTVEIGPAEECNSGAAGSPEPDGTADAGG